MNGQTHGGVRAKIERLRDFFSRRIWDVRLDQLSPRDALRYRSLRVVYSIVRGLFFTHELSLCAAALTYYTVLSLGPLLALGFALLKGFGGYDALIAKTVRPYLLEAFGANPAMQRVIERVMDFVAHTNSASLGFVGLLLLLYAATRLLHNIEAALNDIWDVKAARGPLHQLTQYVAIIVVTPTCLLAAAALGTIGQSSEALGSVPSTLKVVAVLDWMIAQLGPLVIVFVGLVFLYIMMPNTHVRVRSAVIGAVFGALLWYTALILHVRFQSGVASFNLVYSGFAAIPLFLVWLDVSWLAVLVGAEVAATHQHERARAQRRRAAEASQELREALCLSALLRLARAALDSTPPPTLRELSVELDAPEPLLYAGVQQLAGAGLVVKAGSETDPRWVLGRDPEHIHVKDVLDALRGGDGMDLQAWPGLNPGAVHALVQLECELERTAANRSLRELVADD